MFEQYDDILTIEEVSEILKIGMTKAYQLLMKCSFWTPSITVDYN